MKPIRLMEEVVWENYSKKNYILDLDKENINRKIKYHGINEWRDASTAVVRFY